MLVWRPRPSGTSSPRLLARGYPGAAHGPHRPVTAPRRRRSAWLSAEREIRARVVDTSDVARMEQVVADVEAATVARYTKGSHHCAWAPDKYSKAGCNDHKEVANRLFVDSCLRARGCEAGPAVSLSSSDHFLVLDSSAAGTSEKLIQCGARSSHIFIPNIYSHVVHSLRQHSADCGQPQPLRAFLSDVRSFLAHPGRPSHFFAGAYVDACLGLPAYTSLAPLLFDPPLVVNGGVLALTCDMRDPQNPSRQPLPAFCDMLALCANDHGFILDPVQIFQEAYVDHRHVRACAVGSERGDRGLPLPAVCAPFTAYVYEGMFFVVARVWKSHTPRSEQDRP